MTYTDGLSGVLAEIGQIQAALSCLPQLAQPGDFESFLAMASALPDEGGPVTSAPGSATIGWPLEEGLPVSPQLTTAGSVSDAPQGTYESAALGLSPGAPALASPQAALAGSQGLGQQVVAEAERYLGTPYRWGGTDPSQGLDCSGLVQDVFANLGIHLPRTSQEQAQVGTPVPSLADAQPGDLVFFPGSDGTAAAPGHVGIYIGNGQMIDAPYTGARVRVDPVGSPTAIRRVIGGQAALGLSAGSASSAPAPGLSGYGLSGYGLSGYGPVFAQAAARTGVPQDLLAALASTESGGQPGAVSRAGAEGLMQLMPATAAKLGANPFDPSQAINAAADLLSSYYQQFGSWPLALAAYNAGPAAVRSSGGIPPYPQTQAYVQSVLSRAGMEQP